MMEFTTIYFDYGIYSPNKVKLKKIISEYRLKWIPSKMKLGISNEELFKAFKFFKVDNRVVNDENLKGRNGSVGIWESSSEAIKIIMIDKKEDSEHLPVLLVYKGIETSEFYQKFIQACIKLGCEVGKIIETEKGMEEIFKKRINIDLVNKLDSVEGTKEVMKEMFQNQINSMSNVGHLFSDDFIREWKKCIEKYANYTREMLYAEIRKVNDEKKINKLHEDSVTVHVVNIMQKEIKKAVDESPSYKIDSNPFIGKKFAFGRKLVS